MEVNLVLKPLSDTNDPTWSIIISLVILLLGVGYIVYMILNIAYKEMDENVQEIEIQKEGQTVEAIQRECDCKES
jgi:hypothetical protein